MAESKEDLSADFDHEFSTHDLVNAPDMDVFLKLIMFMDEKSSQCLRGELNHIAAKYIDRCPRTKAAIKKNNYLSYDIKYLSEYYHKTKEIQIKLFTKSLKTLLVDLIKETDSIFNTFRLISKYVKGLEWVRENKLTPDDSIINSGFAARCCEREYQHLIIPIHSTLYKLVSLQCPTYNSTSTMLNRFEIRTSYDRHTMALKSVGVVFICENLHITSSICMRKLTDEQIQQMLKYFAECEKSGFRYEELCDTLTCFEDDEDYTDSAFDYEETIKYARSPAKK
jgi:hypothetical protein